MTGGARAVQVLIDEAWTAHGEDRYARAADAGGRAVQVAEALDDPGLLVRALVAEAAPLMMLGDNAAALVRYTRVLGLANDPGQADALSGPQTARAIARAYLNWVTCARFLTGIGWRDLFGVLDAADRWVTATGHRDWRCGILLQRAMLHHRLGERDAAVAAGQEALAVYSPDAAGFTLGTYRSQLGDFLRAAGRHDEARPLYQAILDDPDTGSYERKLAHQGLAWCALDSGDPAAARRHAEAGVRLGEPLGDDVLCPALEVLVAACRATSDLEGAWQAATRHLDAAVRVGGHLRPYFAIRGVVDVALDRGDLPAARRLLADLDTHAAALDTTATGTTYTDETTRRHQRLAELDIGAQAP